MNLNQGTPEEIIAAAKFFIGAAFIWYLEVYPAAVDIFSSTVIPEPSRSKIRAQLKKFLPAGVSLDSFGQFDETNPFMGLREIVWVNFVRFLESRAVSG